MCLLEFVWMNCHGYTWIVFQWISTVEIPLSMLIQYKAGFMILIIANFITIIQLTIFSFGVKEQSSATYLKAYILVHTHSFNIYLCTYILEKNLKLKFYTYWYDRYRSFLIILFFHNKHIKCWFSIVQRFYFPADTNIYFQYL